MTALHWAAYLDDLETAKLLIAANVNATNRYGVMPLSLACQNGNTAMVELLLERGADPNATLRGGETVLMTAARTGKPGPVKALLASARRIFSWPRPPRMFLTCACWSNWARIHPWGMSRAAHR